MCGHRRGISGEADASYPNAMLFEPPQVAGDRQQRRIDPRPAEPLRAAHRGIHDFDLAAQAWGG